MPSSALSARSGRREPRWALPPSTPSCRRSRREPTTPASPSPSYSRFLLSAAYLRTRALWVSWGLNFGWKASRALLFGLAVSGVSSHSPVVQGDPMGPFWLTGGAYGLDGSWLACLVLLAALPVVFRVTRDLDYRYNAPVIVPGGIPVDLDAAARAQHEAAMGPAAPAAPALGANRDNGAAGGEQGTASWGSGSGEPLINCTPLSGRRGFRPDEFCLFLVPVFLRSLAPLLPRSLVLCFPQICLFSLNGANVCYQCSHRTHGRFP